MIQVAKSSPVIVSNVSAQEISRTQDTNAGEVILEPDLLVGAYGEYRSLEYQTRNCINSVALGWTSLVGADGYTPIAGSPLLGAASFAGWTGFDTVTYIGAFDGSYNWMIRIRIANFYFDYKVFFYWGMAQ